MPSDLSKYLSSNEIVELLTLSHDSLKCKNYSELKGLMLALKKLFDFEFTQCCFGNLNELLAGNLNESNVGFFNVSYPEQYLEMYLKNHLYLSDAVLLEFVTSLSPINWLKVDKKCNFNYPAATLAFDFSMFDGWTHGTIDVDTMDVHLFFFGSSVAAGSNRTKQILEHIVPFYCEAYKRVLDKSIPLQENLTAREIEVLEWVKEGKSSWEISVILNVSKRTIDFHISNIKKKLNATNRAQAVATALHRKIISF